MKTTSKQRQHLIEWHRRSGFPKCYQPRAGDRVTVWAGSPPKPTGHEGTVTDHHFRGRGPQVLWDNGTKSRVSWYTLEKLD